MRKETRNQAIALATISATFVLAFLASHCFFVVDFDKKMVMPADGFANCTSDDQCQCNPSNPAECGDQWFCNECDDTGDTPSFQCISVGTNADSDGWWVCPGAPRPDCNDSAPSIYPGANETPNLEDDDCDGVIDEGVIVAALTPQTLSKASACGSPCTYSDPVAVYRNPNIHLAWESDEGVSAKLVRVGEIVLPSTPNSDNQYLIYSSTVPLPTFNMTDPYIALSGDTNAVGWIDHLGGGSLDLNVFTIAGIGSGFATGPTWESDASFPDNPGEPVVATRSGSSFFGMAWIGEDTSGTVDVYFSLFNSSGDLQESYGTGGLINVSNTAPIGETGRPGLIDAYTGYAIAWVEPPSAVRIWYGMRTDSFASAASCTVPTTGMTGHRDPVLVRSDSTPANPKAYLVFAAVPSGQTATEVFAMSVDLEEIDSTCSAAIFGPPLQVSNSTNKLSADVTAAWTGNAIGIAWSDRETGSRIYFRRIADLSVGSGTFASDRLDLSENGSGTAAEGQNPTIVAIEDDHFAVVWSGGGNLYIRQVKAAD